MTSFFVNILQNPHNLIIMMDLIIFYVNDLYKNGLKGLPITSQCFFKDFCYCSYWEKDFDYEYWRNMR